MFTYKTTTHYYKNEDYEKTTKDNITTIKIKVAGYNKENCQLYYLENSKFVLININKNEKIFELNINNYKNKQRRTDYENFEQRKKYT